VSDALLEELADRVVGEVSPGASLSRLTTLRVGGPARALVVAERDEDLAAVGSVCRQRDLDWVVVGRGSNLLVADAGWPGVAIRLGRAYRGIESLGDTVRLGAAESLPSLAMRLADEGYAGFAWAAAVPGTLGGAVRMNAGAHGSELSEHLVDVDVVRLCSGTRETWPAEQLGLTYRHSDLPHDAVVVAATLRLARGEREQIREEIREIRAWRREHQPSNEPSCGSVFTNPPDDSAGRLVEAVGGKGLAVGGARVSERHANFIVTSPGARASDVRSLIARLQGEVEEHFGVRLRPEVVMVGDFSAPAER
jgi:UDP-N-acetylmuramate dehydrogenase